MLISSWDHLFEKFSPKTFDIYYREGYVKPLAQSEEEAVCYVYQESGAVFLCPLLLRPIGETGYKDAETPYGYGGPIINIQDAEFLARACDAMVEELRGAGVVAGFLRLHPILGNHEILRTQRFIQVIPQRESVAMDLTLTEEDIWLREIHPKNRNAIRQAQRAGLKFEIDWEWKFFPEFFALYGATMDRVSADDFYYFNEQYFKLFAKLGQQAFLGVVRKDGVCISAAIFMRHGPFGHYHLSASDMNYKAFRPNNLLLFEAARAFKAMGVESFHLGGGVDVPGGDALLRFKERFSAKKIMFYIGKAIFAPREYESLCCEWEIRFPEKKERYDKFVLKYRY